MRRSLLLRIAIRRCVPRHPFSQPTPTTALLGCVAHPWRFCSSGPTSGGGCSDGGDDSTSINESSNGITSGEGDVCGGGKATVTPERLEEVMRMLRDVDTTRRRSSKKDSGGTSGQDDGDGGQQHLSYADGGISWWKEPPVLAQSSAKSLEDTDKAKAAAVSKLTLRSVVKIYASTSAPNYLLPWQRKQLISISGSGFIVDLKRRLVATNAHVVANAPFVEVRKHGDPNKYVGNIVYIGYDCDLALVAVTDDGFWKEAAALEFLRSTEVATTKSKSTLQQMAHAVPSSEGTATIAASGLEALMNVSLFGALPDLQQSVKVVGYPLGGDQISVTSGVVSRIDMSNYAGTDVSLMSIQLDAAINKGNSGGPALCDAKVVGVAFQTLASADSIGYIIPNVVVGAFFREYIAAMATKLTASSPSTPSWTSGDKAGCLYHPGFASIGIHFQELHNRRLRGSFGLMDSSGDSGLLVQSMRPLCSVRGILAPGDVITHIDGYKISNDGTIEFRDKERLQFSHVIKMQPKGQEVQLGIIRDRKPQTVACVPAIHPSLVPRHIFSDEYKEEPKFELLGGVVFSSLTTGLLLEWGAQWYNDAPRWLVQCFSQEHRSEDRREAVVISQVIPHEVTRGYENFYAQIVTHVNDVPVRDLEHFRELVSALPSTATASTTASGDSTKEESKPNPVRKEPASTRSKPSDSWADDDDDPQQQSKEADKDDEASTEGNLVRISTTNESATATMVLDIGEARAANEEIRRQYRIPEPPASTTTSNSSSSPSDAPPKKLTWSNSSKTGNRFSRFTSKPSDK